MSNRHERRRMRAMIRKAPVAGAPANLSSTLLETLLQGEENGLMRGIMDRNAEGFLRFSKAMVSEFGIQHASRETTVVHECGHVITGLALGGTFIGCEVYPDRIGGWSGITDVAIPGVNDAGVLVNVTLEPNRCRLAAVHMIAGFVAEEVAGFGHGASSLDERFAVTSIAYALADRDGTSVERQLMSLHRSAECLIDANRPLFESLRSLFDHADRIEPAALAALVERHGVETDPAKAAVT